MTRVAAYCRVSTDQSDQLNSFESQIRFFRDYITHHPDWTLVEIYADEGITGTSTRKRERFNAMIRDARAGKFTLILTKEVSRFSRNILDTISYTRELSAIGVGVVFLNDGISTLDPDAELRLSIMGSIAQEESRRTSQRVKWGQTQQMKQGVVFGRSMLGYDIKNGVLSVDPEGAAVVRMIFEKYTLEQKGTTVIARELREQGVRTFQGNREWNPAQVLKILKNEKYVGDLVQKKTITPNYLTHHRKRNLGEEEFITIRDHHQPIIDRALWEQTVLRIARSDRRGEPVGHSSQYLFSGRVRCGECGSVFVPRQRKRKDGSRYQRWCCSRALRQGRDACPVGVHLSTEQGLLMVSEAFRRAVPDREELVRCTAAAALPVLLKAARREDIPQLLSEVERLRDKRVELTEGYLDGSLTRAELLEIRDRCDEKISDLEERLRAAREFEISGTAELRGRIAEVLHDALTQETGAEALWREVLESVTVFRDRRALVRFRGLGAAFSFRIPDRNVRKCPEKIRDSCEK